MALRPKSPKTESDKRALTEEARQDVFLREVDEAVRQDAMTHAAKRYGMPVAILVVLVLAGFGGYLWWEHDRTQKAEAASTEFVLALDRLEANQPDSALAKSQPLESSKIAGVRIPAMLLDAGIAQQKGEADKAAKLYEAAIADQETPQPMRDLATLRLVSMQFDKMKPADVIARLESMAIPGNPFFASAAELVGMAYIEQGKPEKAGPLFAQIARDEDAPDGLRARARQIAGLLGSDSIDDVEAVVEQIERASMARAANNAQAGR